jgi:hypothetical protein
MKVLRNANTIATTAAILIPVQCTVQKLLFEEIKKSYALYTVYCKKYLFSHCFLYLLFMSVMYCVRAGGGAVSIIFSHGAGSDLIFFNSSATVMLLVY